MRALAWVRDFIKERGYSPTLDELADGLGVSKPTVQQYLRALEAKSLIVRQRYAHRSIEITRPEYAPGRGFELPLLGRIAAGQPIEAVEVPETVDVGDALRLRVDKELFALQVKGYSMVEEGILDGDYVIVERRATAENGQTVVALLPDNTATLKKLYKEKNRVRLQPAHPDMKPIYVREVTVQGVVRGVFRPVR
jgi:repressor LexA